MLTRGFPGDFSVPTVEEYGGIDILCGFHVIVCQMQAHQSTQALGTLVLRAMIQESLIGIDRL